MLPLQVEFPKFVADQLLTSEDLNQLFGYLDEQNRMTRTNLIGIGIVCGLHVQINNTKTQVTITKGCGVTSEGYLISVNTKSYSQYKKYKVDTPRIYDNFYKDDGSGNKVPMDVWELRQPAVDPDLVSIDESFLTDKVILLFVELKEEDNKNCDPNSCDDKGINVTVSFLPMAVSKADANLLMGATSGMFGMNTYTSLPEIRMKRWDVPNTSPVYTQDIFDAYFQILSKSFIDDVEAKLENIYTVFGAAVASDYATNPFDGLSAKFAYLYDGSINLNQIVHLQYYYDLFSDLLLAYEEFRKAGTHVLSTCCPDSSLFPRHLLLGEALPIVTTGLLPYRHYFIYSPLFDQEGMFGELKGLFRRLVLMIDQFFLPSVQGNNTKLDDFIRITPSTLWNVPLSHKAIPYYYVVNSGSQPLYRHWDYRRNLLNDAQRNLSYHATQYNGFDEFVRSPLLYDLEPYNFLRIEGIVGKSYVHVLKQVKHQIAENRLPVDIIALSTDFGVTSLQSLAAAQGMTRGKDLEMLCYFQDLESMYASMRREILCSLCKELRYYYDFTFPLLSALLKKYQLSGQTSTVELFDVCNKGGYVIKDKSLGVMIEFLHRQGFTDETLTLENFFGALGFNLQDADNDDIPDVLSGQASAIYLAMLNFFKIPLGIIRLSTLLTDDLASFDVKAYCSATEKLSEYAKSLKAIFTLVNRSIKNSTSADGSSTGNTNAILGQLADTGNSFAVMLILLLFIEDFLDHLDVLIYNCKCSALLSLKKDFLKRYLLFTRLRQFGYFTKMHPGIQHKAGVPMGGTFIIIYHSRQRRKIVGGSNYADFVAGNSYTYSTYNSYANYSGNANIAGGSESLAEQYVSIAGVVKDETGATVPGAIVSIIETGEGTTTNADGRFSFEGSIIPYTLSVEAVGYEVFEEVKNDDATNLEIVLVFAQDDMLADLQSGTVIADFYLPYRCCSDCPPIQYVIKDSPDTPTPNQGPKADAGADQVITLPTNKVTLSGGGSTDPDGTIREFYWMKMSGPGTPKIETENSAQTDVSALEQGEYVFRLQVKDDKGSFATDDVKVTVLPAPPPPNKPPVANPGKDTTVVLPPTNNSIILDGSASTDEDGSILEYKWTQVSGVAVHIVSPSLDRTVVSGLQPGVYVFQLTVTDNEGASNSKPVTITVAPPENQKPIADAGPDQAVTLSPNTNSITLNGSNSKDPDGGALTFKWANLDGPSVPQIVDPQASVTKVNGLLQGQYKFGLTVIDDQGLASDQDEVMVTVKFRDGGDVVKKVCGPLPSIVDEFKNISAGIPTDVFGAFQQQFGIAFEYFKFLESIQDDVAQQLKFFAGPFNDKTHAEWIIEWLEATSNWILEGEKTRSIGLRFYKILLDLTMYIACIQSENNEVVKSMIGVMKVILRHVKLWIKQDAFPMSDIEFIGVDINNELARIENNNESKLKADYVKALKAIISALP